MAGGIITLMGSGELSGTMVEVHKDLLQRYGSHGKAVFLDTPAGFQLNVDDLSARAVAYFKRHIQRPLTVASLKRAKQVDALETAKAYDLLSRADYIFMGPGSPTYAVEQWRSSRIPELFLQHLHKGGSLVAASAAALTMGTMTLPVYEIYKVGQATHWVDGLGLLAHFGFNWAVLPHWNNTEGGTHDTRHCFMGSERLQELRKQLPESVNILGLDEHTALEIDLARETAQVKGLGRITLLSRVGETVFSKGDQIPLAVLREAIPAGSASSPQPAPEEPLQVDAPETEAAVWSAIHILENRIKDHLAQGQVQEATRSLLDLESFICQAQQELEEKDALGAVRDVFRELLAELGSGVARRTRGRIELDPLVNNLLVLRDGLREQKQWAAADAIRECLLQADIVINDAADGASWRIDDTRGTRENKTKQS